MITLEPLYIPDMKEIEDIVAQSNANNYTKQYAAKRAAYWFNMLGNEPSEVLMLVNKDLK